MNLVGTPLTLRDGRIYAGEVPILLRTATVQYFRLAEAEWRDRLHKVRSAGFDAAEVYVPWNDHEVAPGVFDFVTGRHNLLGFLSLAAELGVAVVLRPGPYICAEFEGGGLPARVCRMPRDSLREDRSPYVEEALTYWRAVLSSVAPLQADRGGPVLMIQVENELDYFPAHDPTAMVRRLADEARTVGITVPLFTCAGSRIPESGGQAPGILPGINVKPPASGAWEERYLQLAQTLAARGLPLFVVETYRDPAVLRRLVAVGVKGLGPYMVTGGIHFGPMNPVNNWTPVPAFLNPDYDFRSPIAADGLLRPPYFALRELFATLDLFPGFFGRAISVPAPRGMTPPEGVFLHGLADGRERIYAFTEDAGTRREITLPWRRGRFLLDLPARDTQFVLEGLALPDGRHVWSTLEPVAYGERAGTPHLVLVGRPMQHGTVAFDREGPVDVMVPRSGTAEWRVDGVWVTVRPREAPPREEYPPDPLRNMSCPDPRPSRALPLSVAVESLVLPEPPDDAPAPPHTPSLEELTWRGVGEALYRFDLPPRTRTIVLAGADVVFVWAHRDSGGEERPAVEFVGADIGTGLPVAWDLPVGTVALTVRVVSWGHSPFEDDRLPSLHMGSLRGLTAPAWAILPAAARAGRGQDLWLAPRAAGRLTRSAAYAPDDAHPRRAYAIEVQPRAAWAIEDHAWPGMHGAPTSDAAASLAHGAGTADGPLPAPLRLVGRVEGVRPGTRVHLRVPTRDAMTVVRLGREMVARQLSGPSLAPHATGGTLPPGEFVLPWGLLPEGTQVPLTVDVWPLTRRARLHLSHASLCLYTPQPLPQPAWGGRLLLR